MKKLLLFALVIVSILLGYSLSDGGSGFLEKDNQNLEEFTFKKPIMRVAIVSDSAGENDLLAKALSQARGKGINFVIGLGDFTDVGTLNELSLAKDSFDNSKLEYFVTAGDHDLWDSRNKALALQSSVDPTGLRGEEATLNFKEVFGNSTQVFERNGIRFIILDNSDIYLGISGSDWEKLVESLSGCFLRSDLSEASRSDLRGNGKLCLVFAHKTPFHPSSNHILGEDSENVAKQAESLLALIENSEVSGFFSGDLHFFAEFKSPTGSVRITTIGAVASERNFQGPRFGILTIFDDYSWEVEDIEIR